MQIWLAIINPSAGNGSAVKKWEKIKGYLKEKQVSFVPLFINEAGTTIEKTKEGIRKGFRRLLVIGGDGTLNEVINAVMSQSEVPTTEFVIGMMPVGTGNDWCRMHKIPANDVERVSEIIRAEKMMLHDIGKVVYQTDEGKQERHFINNAGIGYDAMVVKKANDQKKQGISNRFSYFLNVLTVLFSYECYNVHIKIEGEEYYSKMFSMNVGICKYKGAGMLLVPYAISDDGLLEFTAIRNVSKWKIIMSLNKLYDGSIVKLPEILSMQSEKIDIDSDQKMPIEVDGEVLGYSPFKFSIFHKAVWVVVP